MSRAIAKHQFHSFPRLGYMLMIKLFKIHNIIPQSDDISGRKILRDKSIFALVPRINTFLGKDEIQILARSLSENGNNAYRGNFNPRP